MRTKGSKRPRKDDESDHGEPENDEDSSSNLTPVNVPKGKEKDSEFVAPKGQKLTDLDEDGTQNKEESGNVVEQTHYIIIPSYASWFDYNAINQLEKRGVPVGAETDYTYDTTQ
uniref:Uncharacterized protein n=1 Tax=Acrobeloides nanus TaxID=290746 RepID=A0A914DFE9_9BILA